MSLTTRAHGVLVDFLAIAAGGGTIAAWQDQVEWSLKIVASLVAIVAGVASLMAHRKKRKQKALSFEPENLK